jgi:putative ABC transport system permease protein
VQTQIVAHDFFATLDMRLLAGRAFSRDRASDVAPFSPAARETRTEPRKMVIDRTTAEHFGWRTPADAVGQLLYGGPADRLGAEIIGVVEPKPLTLVALSDTFVYLLAPDVANAGVVALARDDVTAGLEALDAAWQRLAPGYPLRREFFDDAFASSYALFDNANLRFVVLSVATLCIASGGLFGLASFIVARRRREIGIRKIHGARAREILALLLVNFTKPILLANLIAWPAGWFALRAYLDLFVQRTALTPWPFVASLATTVVVAGLAVAAHVRAAARVHPAEVLRDE